MSSSRSLYNSELASSLAAQSRTLYNTIISYLQSSAAKTFRNVQITGGSLTALTGLDSTFGSFSSLTLGSKTIQDIYLTLLGYGSSILAVTANNIKISNFTATLDASNILFTGSSKLMGSIILDTEKLHASAITPGQSLSLTTPVNKIYCDTSADCTVMLANGSQDGQLKLVQWLPSSSASSSTTFPRLIISGSFCFPQYETASEQFFSSTISDQSVILPTTGVSIMLLYDAQMMAWVPTQSGATFTTASF